MSQGYRHEIKTPTEAMLSALKWFRNRGGDGVFDKNQVLVARGERAPVMRATWTRLAEDDLVEFYLHGRRIRISSQGLKVNLSGVSESE